MSSYKFILAVDLGGTHCRYRLMQQVKDSTWVELSNAKYINSEHASFSHSLRTFFSSLNKGNVLVETSDVALSAGVAGVVNNQFARLTNHPWDINAPALIDEFKFRDILLLNDLQAAAFGIHQNNPDKIILERQGDNYQPAIVLGVGTGCGMAYTYKSADGRVHVNPTEVGHTDFVATNRTGGNLKQSIAELPGAVCIEDILSGSGLKNIYHYFNKGNIDITSAAIIQAAANGDDEHASRAIDMFCEVLARLLGNLTLLFRPGGGIHLLGGMINRLLPWLEQPAFVDNYLTYPRMQTVINQYPIYVYTQDDIALSGAHYAMVQQVDISSD